MAGSFLEKMGGGRCAVSGGRFNGKFWGLSTLFENNDPSKVAYCKGACPSEARFLILGLGGRQNLKKTYFWRFWEFFAYNPGVSQPIFFNDPSKVAYCKGACPNEARFLILGLGGRQKSKNTLFLTFLLIKMRFLFLNWFSLNRAQNACIDKDHVTTEPNILFSVRGRLKQRKTPYFFYVFFYA